MSWRDDLAVLRHRDVRLFVGGRFVSTLGSSIAPVALVFAVLDVSDAASAVGIVLAARSIPNIVFLLIGGVIADRLPRNLVLVGGNLICAITQGMAAALILSGRAEIWQLAAIEALNGIAAAFVMPAAAGILPAIVPRDELGQATALSGFAKSVAIVGGGAAAGVIVGLTNPGIGLAVDALTFLLGALFFVRLKLPPIERTKSSVLHDLRVGWSEFASRQWVWVIVAVFCLINVVYAACYQTLGPVIADDTFGRVGWGVVSSCFAVGLILGGVLMVRLKPRYLVRTGMFGMLAVIPMYLCLGLYPNLVAVAVAAFVLGIGMDVFGITWETALGQHVPLDKLSRVASYDMVGSFVATPAGQIAVGYLAVVVSARAVELYGAVLHLVLVVAALLVPSVWRLERVTG